RARQLFTNLVENAARHGERRPLTITVRSRGVDHGPVVVEVADDGVGIPAAERERVFQIFQRLGGFDVESPGSGIGLTMCRRIVEDVGGTIEVADAETGTILRLELPTPSRSGSVASLHHQGA
ncbi:MAG TPA: ATP-binding protein, partial [Euzebya sp.]|nr:ATP-binding protein [Euzebya sp.]